MDADVIICLWRVYSTNFKLLTTGRRNASYKTWEGARIDIVEIE